MKIPTAFTELLASEYNCTPEDLTKKDNLLTVSAFHAGRRNYSTEKDFFRMVTLGAGAVITADEALHPFLREWMRDRMGHWLFELPNLRPLEQELHRFGYALTGTMHLFLSQEEATPTKNFPVKWFCDEENQPLYGDPRFPNAVSETEPYRPQRITVCAYDGKKLMGAAGCTEDAPHFLQIGVDVLPEYRSRGVGTYLVTLLKNKIHERGDIPFYLTSVSNYHSWNIALNSGFRPICVEIMAQKI